jgi:hypothetical protein
VAAEETQNQKRVQAAIGLAGSLVALGAYLYLLGGLVLWLKFTAARLPTDDAVRVLDGNRLLTVGIKALVFEILLLVVLLIPLVVTWYWVRDPTTADRAKLERENKWEAWKLVLHGIIVAVLTNTVIAKLSDAPMWAALAISLLAAIIWVVDLLPWVRNKVGAHRRIRWAVKIALTMVVALVAMFLLAAPAGVGLLVLLLFLHLSHLREELPTARDPMKLVRAVLVLALGLSLIVAAYLATPPVALDRAILYTEGGGIIRGGFVGESGEGVFLATCHPSPVNPKVGERTDLRIIAADQVRRIDLGGSRYILDYGKDPSLVDLGRYLVARDSIGELTDTVPMDVRDPKLVCGRKRFMGIISDPGRLRLLRVWLGGAGTVHLSGGAIRPLRRVVAAESVVSLPLKLKKRHRHGHGRRCRRWLDTEVEVQFRLHDGDIERNVKRIRVVLPPLERSKPRMPALSCARVSSSINAR